MSDECACTVMRFSTRFGPTEWARNPECGIHGDTRHMARRIRELGNYHDQCNDRIAQLEAEKAASDNLNAALMVEIRSRFGDQDANEIIKSAHQTVNLVATALDHLIGVDE